MLATGVLLALAADSWREGRAQSEAEVITLHAMRASLTADLVSLNNSINALRTAEAASLALKEHLAARRPYADSLTALFGLVNGTGGPTIPNMAPYEALKSIGLHIVSSDSLRLQIIGLYENRYRIIAAQNDVNVQVVFEVLRPYYLAHFAQVRFSQAATPLDYRALLEDVYFQNLLFYRADIIRRALLDPYELAVRDVERLMASIDEELGAR